jgi:hypothetical protein
VCVYTHTFHRSEKVDLTYKYIKINYNKNIGVPRVVCSINTLINDE